MSLSFLLAAQPTRGLDVGAVEAVYGQIREAAARGVAVLLVSSELDEILAVAHRVVVLYRGRIVGQRPARPSERAAIGALMAGHLGMTDAASTLRRAAFSLRGAAPALGVPAATVLFAFAVGLLLVVAIGVPLGDAVAAFARGAFGSPYAIAVSLNRAVDLGLVGLGFVFANRAGLTNVGGEGQIAVGGIVATAVALHGGAAGLPPPLSFLWPMLAAAAAGALWGGIAGVLKVRAGTNEVISTLLLSFIAVWLVYWSVQSTDLLRQPMTSSATLPESLEIAEATQLPLLTGDYAAPVTIGLVIAALLAVVIAVVLGRFAFGFRLRAVGLNPVASRRAGIAVGRTIVTALVVAGALGGLAGAVMLQGEQYALKAGFSSGYGFDGLVVGLLARGSVVGVAAGALLFGFLRSGGISMEMAAAVPSALVMIIQGLIVVTVAGAAWWLDRPEARR